MSNFIPPAILTDDGNYEINTRFSRQHLMTLKGNFDGATVTMTAYNDATGAYTDVDNGSWTAATEVTFDAPSDTIRLAVSSAGASTSIAVTLTPTVKR